MSKKTVITVILAIIGITSVSIGAYQIYKIHKQDFNDQALQNDLQELHNGGGRDSGGIDQGLAALNAKNSDCIYWLRIPDTIIDYPVMHRPKDKDYYLYRDFNEEYSPSGTLYLAEDCDPVHGDNLIIYGHHMRTGTMFAHLEDYKDEEFYKKHKKIELETLQGHEDYEIIAAFTTPVYTGHDFEYYKFTSTDDPQKFYDYVSKCKNKSIYQIDKTAEYGQRLLTLSTCEYSQKNGRMVVVAVQVGKQSKTVSDSDAAVTARDAGTQEGDSDGGDR